MNRLIKTAKKPYHYLQALKGAALFGFPGRRIKVVAITGTKGKTSTAEIVSAMLEEAGYKTALAGTLRFKVGEKSEPNKFKMTMVGRGRLQKFLRDAVRAKCDWAVMEMTSQGAEQFRHLFIPLDALIVTNISPEHIESHGSYEKYVAAKLRIGTALERSRKRGKILIVNDDEPETHKFLRFDVPTKLHYRVAQAKPYSTTEAGSTFAWDGGTVSTSLPGLFNISNMLAAATFGKAIGIPSEKIRAALGKVTLIRGRMERITLDSGAAQNFTVIVDYAHTADSLEKAYRAFPTSRKICVLGNTGGGRDKWKRPEMAKIADEHCDEIILTNEDPYDEDPRAILADMEKGFSKKQPEIIMDRRDAIAAALRKAQPGDAVIITGKGTDPFIMGPNGSKIPWDDATVAREELQKVLK